MHQSAKINIWYDGITEKIKENENLSLFNFSTNKLGNPCYFNRQKNGIIVNLKAEQNTCNIKAYPCNINIP